MAVLRHPFAILFIGFAVLGLGSVLGAVAGSGSTGMALLGVSGALGLALVDIAD